MSETDESSHAHLCDGCGKPAACHNENCIPDAGYMCAECLERKGLSNVEPCN